MDFAGGVEVGGGGGGVFGLGLVLVCLGFFYFCGEKAFASQNIS